MDSKNRHALLSAAQSFCNAFASKRTLSETLRHFSQSEDPVVIEHGLAMLAPFLGVTYVGLSGVRDYFETIASLLTYDRMYFSNFVVDADVLKVSVRGEADFTWRSSNQTWHEVFTYTLAFDKELKVKRYEIWADSGAAYLASKGELNS